MHASFCASRGRHLTRVVHGVCQLLLHKLNGPLHAEIAQGQILAVDLSRNKSMSTSHRKRDTRNGQLARRKTSYSPQLNRRFPASTKAASEWNYSAGSPCLSPSDRPLPPLPPLSHLFVQPTQITAHDAGSVLFKNALHALLQVFF